MSLNDEVIDLIETKFNPEDFSMFIEAIKSGCFDNYQNKISECFKHRNHEKLGLYVMNAVISKLDQMAEDEIAGQFNSTLGGGTNEWFKRWVC